MIVLKESTVTQQDYLQQKIALMDTIVMRWPLFTLTSANMESTLIPAIMESVQPVLKINTVRQMHSLEIALARQVEQTVATAIIA